MFRDRDGWRVQWRDALGRHSQKFDSKKEAAVFEANLKAGLIRRDHVSHLTFGEFSKRWLEDYCKVEKAKSQLVTNESVIRVHLEPAFGPTRLSDLTKARLVAFRAEMRRKVHPKSKRPLSVGTVNVVLQLLRSMLQTAVDWDLLPAFPAGALRSFRTTDRAVSYWTAEERDRFHRFVRHTDPAFADLVLVAARTGLRMSELAGLTRKQLDFDRGVITVDRIYCFKTKQDILCTKSRRIGFVPMDDEVTRTLTASKLRAMEGRIFPVEMFRDARYRLGRFAKKAGVTEIRWHDLRHSFASALVQAGVDLYQVQRLLRHQSPAMTQRYAHLAPDTLRQAVEALARASGTQKAPGSESACEVVKFGRT